MSDYRVIVADDHTLMRDGIRNIIESRKELSVVGEASDGIQLLKWSFVKLDSFTLENAAQHYLSDGKLFTGKQRYEQIEDAYKNDPEKLIAYNMKDAQLVLDILSKSGTLKLTQERSRITGMPAS